VLRLLGYQAEAERADASRAPTPDLIFTSDACFSRAMESNSRTEQSDVEPSGDDSVMALVRRLRGVSFEWREDMPSGHRGKDLGVIAQEVEEVFPELVHVDPRGYKTVNYLGLIAPLIEAVKELDARIAALEATRDTHEE
jgi:hypothetical protein